MILIIVIQLGEHVVPSVVDSGSTNTYVGSDGLTMALESGFETRSIGPVAATITDGGQVTCTEVLDFMVTLDAPSTSVTRTRFA